MTTGRCKIVKEFIICLLRENDISAKRGRKIYSIKTTVIFLLLLAWSHHLKVLLHPQSESPPNYQHFNGMTLWVQRGKSHSNHAHISSTSSIFVYGFYIYSSFPIFHILKTHSKQETHSKHFCSLFLDCNVVFTLYSHLLWKRTSSLLVEHRRLHQTIKSHLLLLGFSIKYVQFIFLNILIMFHSYDYYPSSTIP